MAPPAPSDRAAPPAVSVPQAMPSQPATHSSQPPLRDCVGPKTYSSILMGLDEINWLEMEPAYPLEQGIAPSEIFSRAKSTALASNRPTPVPQLVERQQLAILRREAPPHSMAGSMKPTPTHPLAPTNEHLRGRGVSVAPTPYNQLALRSRETSVDTEMPAQDKLTTMSNIFQGQWLLFVNAKEANNFWLMRIALNQAISTQDTNTNLYGTPRMMEISKGWLARDELARMEKLFQIPLQPLPKPPTTRTLPLMAATTAERPPSVSPACIPPAGPLARLLLAPQSLHPCAPPPPPVNEPRAQNLGRELMAPPPVPGQMIPGTGPPPDTYQPVQRAYPEQEGYYAQEQYYHQQQPLPPAHHPYAQYPPNGRQSNPPYSRNHRRSCWNSNFYPCSNPLKRRAEEPCNNRANKKQLRKKGQNDVNDVIKLAP
ncbi:hypothetical protein PCANC_18646 [Puccinia coronata f. sp. avenae]|uniref:Uncharacterized protein n=1 Tax=Puccinia coronata f. sp. avenae TaxID=200324 RepID=A0A2N5U412_9BASI|nr:hypothetical protein PCANC_18646 [Puccinia coronata f. sp. avenae]